jgi:hypothetical protein
MSTYYDNVAVPFITIGNRQVLTDELLAELPFFKEFLALFPDCFERVESLSLWVYWPEGDAPKEGGNLP